MMCQHIRRTRNSLRPLSWSFSLLALSLFKDNVWVGLRAQGRVLANAGKLLLLALMPMLVMTVPMVLVLGQLALWYQARPLQVGEEAVVTVMLSEHAKDTLDHIALQSAGPFEPTIGPVRVPSKNMACWNIKANEPGLHELAVKIGDQAFTKQLAIGDRFMPTSLQRPAWKWTDVVLHPREKPLATDSPVQSIEVAFPERDSWISGTDMWIVYWFAMSLVAAFAAKPFMNVNI